MSNNSKAKLAVASGSLGLGPASLKKGNSIPVDNSGPGSPTSPSRRSNVLRSPYLAKPPALQIHGQAASHLASSLTVTGASNGSTPGGGNSSVAQALQLYQPAPSRPAPTAPASPSRDQDRYRSAGHGPSALSQSSGPGTPTRQPAAAYGLSPPLGSATSCPLPAHAAPPAPAGPLAPNSTVPAVAVAAGGDADLQLLKDQVLKLQRALESLSSPSPLLDSSSGGSGVAGGPARTLSGSGLNLAAIAVPALHAALWSAGGVWGGGSNSSVGSVSSSSIGSVASSGSSGSTASASTNGSSTTTNSSSSYGGPTSSNPLAAWAATAGTGTAGLDALLQAGVPPPSQQQQQQQQQVVSAQDAALIAARAKLLELFIRKAHQLLLESAPELLLPSGMLNGTGALDGADDGAAGGAAGSGRPPLPPGAASRPASGISPSANAARSSNAAAPTASSPIPASRIMSAPPTRGGVGAALADSARPGSGTEPGGVGAGGSASASSSLSGAAGVTPTLASLPPLPADLSPAGVLVAACRRLSQLAAVVTGRDARGAATELALADARAKLESALSDNTLLRNALAELQANTARPQSRGNMRAESAARPPSAAPAAPDPSLLRTISSLTTELGAAKARADAAQKRLEASEAAREELRKHLADALAAAKRPPSTAAAVQVSLGPDPAVAADLEAQRAAAEATQAALKELRARATKLEAEAAEARALRGQREELLGCVSELKAAADAAEAERRRLAASLADAGRGAAAASEAQAEADAMRRQLEADHRKASELAKAADCAAADLRSSLDKARSRIGDLESKLSEAEAKAKAAATAAAGEVRGLKAALSEAEAAAARQADAMRRAEAALAKAQEEVKRAAGDAEALRRRLGAAEAAAAAAQKEAAAAVEAGDRNSAELGARISHLTGEVKRLGEELRAVQAEAEAARALAARWEADATALHAEKLEAAGRLNRAHLDLEAERQRLAAEVAATVKQREELLADANTVKALGTLTQAKTLRLDIGGGALAAAASAAAGGAGGSRPMTADPAAHMRLSNLVKDQQQQLADLQDALAAREQRCGELQVALTAAQQACDAADAKAAARETAAVTSRGATAEREASLARQLQELQAAFDAQTAMVTRLKTQFDELGSHCESVKAHNTELHKMAERLQRDAGVAAAEARELRQQLEVASKQLSEERSSRQRLADQVAGLAQQRDAATADAATYEAQHRGDCSRMEELQAALLLATQKLAGAERTINVQDERIALLQSRLRTLLDVCAALGPAAQQLLPDWVADMSDTASASGGATPMLTSPRASLAAASLQLPPLGAAGAGGGAALGSMVEDMISRVMADAAHRNGTGAGAPKAPPPARSSGAARATSASPSRSSQANQQQPQPGGGGGGMALLLRPSSASPVGRVQEHATSPLPTYGNRAGNGAASGWTSGFTGSGSSGPSARPQSAWVQRNGSMGHGAPSPGANGGSSALVPSSAATAAGGGAAAGAMVRRANSGNHGGGNANLYGLQLLAEADALVGAAAAAAAASSGSRPSYGALAENGSGHGSLGRPYSAAVTPSSYGGAVGGAAGGARAARPGTAVSKRTVLLLSTSSAAGGGAALEEALALDDDWQPV
ncbi:hypothetical protein HXX76_005600 [Chlamydomonas incerta]|uniref:Uncharacterized protein n=1 Tax=Chlamydomonas incerta TaxID=51695 RepID=A0A835T5V4_CHLIN|nr:hypothetical protein HXX76_005600 [Chlamydomonas incerta]|eukprot:KAG2437986.1 hypothetical protein HXX76_005600 [Chlamydomonas incerta]